MATKPTQMAFVRIGYSAELLLPADKAMKLVEILQHAVTCDDRSFSGGALSRSYLVGEQPEVELVMVKANQIQFRPGTTPEPPKGSRTPRIRQEPLKLT